RRNDRRARRSARRGGGPLRSAAGAAHPALPAHGAQARHAAARHPAARPRERGRPGRVQQRHPGQPRHRGGAGAEAQRHLSARRRDDAARQPAAPGLRRAPRVRAPAPGPPRGRGPFRQGRERMRYPVRPRFAAVLTLIPLFAAASAVAAPKLEAHFTRAWYAAEVIVFLRPAEHDYLNEERLTGAPTPLAASLRSFRLSPAERLAAYSLAPLTRARLTYPYL